MVLRPRWRKVLADLWDNRARSLLVIASIAVGVFAIGTIVGCYDYLARDLNIGYLNANPAAITLVTDPLDEDIVASVGRMAGVGDAEGRHTFTVRLIMGPDTWDAMTLVAVRDYEDLRISRFEPLMGAWAPAERQVVLERKTLLRLDAQVGDVIEVELADGTRRLLEVAGAVLDPTGGYAAVLGDPKGFVHYDSLAWLGRAPSMNRLYATADGGATDRETLRALATRITDRIERTGRGVYQVQVSPSDEHPLAPILTALLGVLSALGVLVVLLSGALVANTMSALLNQHTRTIGVMKLVGASRTQIVGSYLALVAALGAIALVVSVPLGALGAYGLSQFAAGIINASLGAFRFVPLAVVLQVVMAMVVPPVAALWPVLSGSRVTVQRALRGSGVGDAYTPGPIAGRLRRVRWLSRPLLISLRNTFRRRGRLLLTMVTLTLGGAVFIAVFNTQVALNAQVERVARYFGADVNVDLARPYRVDRVMEQLMAIPDVVAVEAWTGATAEWLCTAEGPHDAVTLIAPPAGSALVDPVVLAGRWLVPGDEGAIAINEAFWSDHPDLGPGDRLRLRIDSREAQWTVVGVFQYSGIDQLFAYTTYEHLSAAQRRPMHAAQFRLITASHDTEAQQRIAVLVDGHLRDAGFQVSLVEAGAQFVDSVTSLLDVLIAVLLVMAVLTALVGSIGLTGTVSMNVMERTREIGVLRTVGADDGTVATLVIVEGQVIGLMSYVLAAVASFPITALLSNIVTLAVFNAPADWSLTPNGFIIWLCVLLVLATVASLLPARTASRLTIREVLAYE
jgi:putative ABC transport system permease protein